MSTARASLNLAQRLERIALIRNLLRAEVSALIQVREFPFPAWGGFHTLPVLAIKAKSAIRVALWERAVSTAFPRLGHTRIQLLRLITVVGNWVVAALGECVRIVDETEST
jgi:hypothetical protein